MNAAVGCVAAGHPVTAKAATTILAEGGNAFDAAIAAALTACVAEPVLASLGGGGFAMTAPLDGPTRVFDFFTQTPAHRPASPDGLEFHPVLADFGTTTQEFHIGLSSMAVPGMVRGAFDILATHGSLPVADVFAPAIAAAAEGVTVNQFQAHLFDVVNPIFVAEADSRSIYGPGGEDGGLFREGDQLVQPALAQTMAALAHHGPAAFYEGDIAHRVVAACSARGGLLTMDDFAAYRTEVRDPVHLRHGNADISFNPPPSAGGSLIAFALKILGSGLGDLSWGAAAHVNALVDAMLAAQRVRADRGHDLDLDDDGLIARYRAALVGRAAAHRGTTHISVVDGAGNAAAVTLSNGEGCGFVVPDTGVMMNNMLGEEDLNPGGFHRWRANTRMISMMAPTIARAGDGRLVCVGSGGSNRIRSAILQVLINVLDFRMDAESAVSAARLHVENGRLDTEPGLDPGLISDRGDEIVDRRAWDDRSLFFGGAHLVVRQGDGTFDAAGDPRRGGVAVTA